MNTASRTKIMSERISMWPEGDPRRGMGATREQVAQHHADAGEIAETLREWGGQYDNCLTPHGEHILEKAASLIERQAAEIERLREALRKADPLSPELPAANSVDSISAAYDSGWDDGFAKGYESATSD
jgi:hypothetical protein